VINNSISLIKIKDTKVQKHIKRFVVTSYSLGSEVNSDFLGALRFYCKLEKAQLIIIPLKNNKNTMVDEQISEDAFILKDTNLNSNIKLLGILNRGNSYGQPMGITRVSSRGESCIVGGNAITLKYVATEKGKLPHFVATTGSINILSTEKNDKAAYLAKLDHKLGAMIIEIENDVFFHQRHIEFMTITSSFIDLNKEYFSNKVKKAIPSHLVLGDWHSGETDKKAYLVWKDLTKKLGVKTWVLHDTFNGSSINHHELHNMTKRAQKANTNGLSLRDELEYYAKDMISLSKQVSEIVIVKSNHDEFLDRYLAEGTYFDEPFNFGFCLGLHSEVINNNVDPLQYGFKLIDKVPTNIKWLGRDESYRVGGIELGVHGDKGANGMRRGSPKTFEDAYGACVVGHSHTPQIMRDVYIVGTTTSPFPDYGSGPNSWVQTSCLVYPNGARQLLNIMNNKVTIKKV
jgi:hypothetical protein